MPFIENPQKPDGLPVVPLWINGAIHPTSRKDHLFPVVSSVQNKPIHYAVSATPETAVLAVESAAAALISWRKTTPSHRRALLLKAASVLESKKEEVMRTQMAETSCPEGFARFNMGSTAWMREIAAATSQLKGTVAQNMGEANGEEGEGLSLVVREPIGVVLIIPP
jgi:acyl-CoA reductase-like NAD-dependent aldehyde dehydrogenase